MAAPTTPFDAMNCENENQAPATATTTNAVHWDNAVSPVIFWRAAFGNETATSWTRFARLFVGEWAPTVAMVRPILDVSNQVTMARFCEAYVWLYPLFATNTAEHRAQVQLLMTAPWMHWDVHTGNDANARLDEARQRYPTRRLFLIRPSHTDPMNMPFTISLATPGFANQHCRIHRTVDGVTSILFHASFWPLGADSPGTTFDDLHAFITSIIGAGVAGLGLPCPK